MSQISQTCGRFSVRANSSHETSYPPPSGPHSPDRAAQRGFVCGQHDVGLIKVQGPESVTSARYGQKTVHASLKAFFVKTL